MSAYDPDPLRVGDRVRVRLSGECRMGHFPEEDRAAGRVTEADPTEDDGHGYWVDYACALRYTNEDGVDGPLVGQLYARAELERLP